MAAVLAHRDRAAEAAALMARQAAERPPRPLAEPVWALAESLPVRHAQVEASAEPGHR